MGYWYTHSINPINKDISLSNMLIKQGIGKIVNRQNSRFFLEIDLELLSPSFCKELEEEGLSAHTAVINMNDNGLSYSQKWAPDIRLLTEISKIFPNEIFLIHTTSDYGDNAFWYEKNGNVCDATGKIVCKDGNGRYTFLGGVNSKLVKIQNNGNYILSLPIGDDNAKWVNIFMPKECIIQDTYSASILFTNETYKVKAGQKIFEISAADICEKYCQAKTEYANKMHELLSIDRSKVSRLINKGDYYIVFFPCSVELSANKQMSIAVSSYDLKNDSVIIGERGRDRNIMLLNDDGTRSVERMNVPDIIKHVEDAYYALHSVSQPMQEEPEQEEER